MAHPNLSNYRKTFRSKMDSIGHGVKGEFPPDKADRLAGTSAAKITGLRREEPLREMQELPKDPVKAAKQLNDPQPVPGKKG